MITIANDEKILDEAFRKMYIEKHIRSEANITRKKYAAKCHDLLKDKTKHHAIAKLEKEFARKTVELMKARASNISFFKKINNKKSKVFTEGVMRTVSDLFNPQTAITETVKIQALAEVIKLDSEMKKIDKFRNAVKNTLLFIAPRKNIEESDDENSKYDIVPEALMPYLYDAIPDSNNKTTARVVVLSDFIDRNVEVDPLEIHNLPNEALVSKRSMSDLDKEDNLIYEWWSKKYHFFTDSKGKIIKTNEIDNPIMMLPFIDYTFDKEGEYWATGGEDLCDGAILLNVIITDLLVIANHQGWGQLIITGDKDALEGEEFGPHYAVILTKPQEDENAPDAKYISANPPLDQWISIIRTYLTLLLISNELSPKGVAGDLAANNIVSGISKILDDAESIADMTDSYQSYADREPLVWKRIKAWQEYLGERQALSENLAEIDAIETTKVVLSFDQRKPVVSEEQRIKILEMRRSLGIDSMIDTLMRDDDSLTREEAEARLMQILKDEIKFQIEKTKLRSSFGGELGNPGNENTENRIDNDNSDFDNSDNGDSSENDDSIDG